MLCPLADAALEIRVLETLSSGPRTTKQLSKELSAPYKTEAQKLEMQLSELRRKLQSAGQPESAAILERIAKIKEQQNKLQNHVVGERKVKEALIRQQGICVDKNGAHWFLLSAPKDVPEETVIFTLSRSQADLQRLEDWLASQGKKPVQMGISATRSGHAYWDETALAREFNVGDNLSHRNNSYQNKQAGEIQAITRLGAYRSDRRQFKNCHRFVVNGRVHLFDADDIIIRRRYIRRDSI